MRIGIAVDLDGASGVRPRPAPTWRSIADQVRAAEAVGFDLVVLPDALLYTSADRTVAFWESVAMMGAVAASTSTIQVGHSVLNAPYRAPALVAKVAETLDEISGGRYVLGMGAGNTPAGEYAAFGVPADRRYSRFAETLEIVHSMLRTGTADLEGRFHTVRDAQLGLRGPRPHGPPIVVAAVGPRMMRLAVRLADGWNGFCEDAVPTVEAFRAMAAELDSACEEAGRDPASLPRSLDVPLGMPFEGVPAPPAGYPCLNGTEEEVAEQVLRFRDIGVSEVRCYLAPPVPVEDRARRLEGMAGLVSMVHAG